MKIRTDRPFQHNRAYFTKQIANFWNKTSLGWKTIWGPHLHHGYFEPSSNSSPLAAQEKLIEKLTALLEIKTTDNIFDVGCGMGGSSLYLAKKYGAFINGITLSSTQIAIANEAAQQEKISNVKFQIHDALSLSEFGKEICDIVWSLESCEQFFDKNLFLQEAHKALKPNGQLLLATWCSDQEEYIDQDAKKYKKLCLAFDLPYMPTIAHYRQLLIKQGFLIKAEYDWTSFVKQSWDIGISVQNTFNFLQILKLGGLRGLRFSKQVKYMQEAFQHNRVRYGVFAAIKNSK